MQLVYLFLSQENCKGLLAIYINNKPKCRVFTFKLSGFNLYANKNKRL